MKTNSHSTSLLLEDKNYDFLQKVITQNSVTKTQVINKALEIYRIYSLKQSLRNGFSLQSEDDLRDAIIDFDDYQKIIEESEK